MLFRSGAQRRIQFRPVKTALDEMQLAPEIPLRTRARADRVARLADEQWLVAGRDIAPLLYELGALAGLVLSLAIALSLARKHSGRISDYEAD